MILSAGPTRLSMILPYPGSYMAIDWQRTKKEGPTVATTNNADVNTTPPGAAPAFPSPATPPPPPPAPPPKKNTALYVGLGCLVAVAVGFVAIFVIGLLAAIAIPAFMKARDNARVSVCMSNLRLIDSAKDQAALDNNHKNGDAIPETELSNYIKNELGGLTCPVGGVYTVNTLGHEPECSVHGTLSAPRRQFGPSSRPPPPRRRY